LRSQDTAHQIASIKDDDVSIALLSSYQNGKVALAAAMLFKAMLFKEGECFRATGVDSE